MEIRSLQKYSRSNKLRGFTLIEILIVIGLIAILAAVVLIAVNPARQFAQARNTQRVSNVNALLNAVGARLADTKGVFAEGSCGAIPKDSAELPPHGLAMGNTAPAGTYDIRPCLVPQYISELPFDPDPTITMNQCTTENCEGEHYNTGYTIAQSASGRVRICAPGYAESALGLTNDDVYCLER